MTRPTRARAAVTGVCALLAASALTGGCSGGLFRSRQAPPTVYELSADLSKVRAAAPAAPDATLTILRPRVRAGLASERIAVLYPDRRLDHFADARWSGPLDEMMQDLVLEAFRSGTALKDVSADSSAIQGTSWLEIEVVEFQAEYPRADAAPTIHVHLRAHLGRAGDSRVLWAGDADLRQSAEANRLTAIVDAFQRACAAALTDLVGRTAPLLARTP